MNYDKKAEHNQELVECLAIFVGFLLVVGIGFALWHYVSPWAVFGWVAVNVAFVAWRAHRAYQYRGIKHQLFD